MYLKYEKTFRVVSPRIRIQGKFCLSRQEQNALLTGRVEITEKMDGANVGIIRSKQGWTLQKRRGLADSIHPQFSFFWNWARHNEPKITQLPIGHIVYGELMYAKHNVHYDELSSYFLVFDIWNGKEFLNHNKRMEMVEQIGFKHVPVLYYGYTETNSLDDFITVSNHSSSDMMEGMVIKNYRKQKRGKLVRAEFIKQLEEDEHWMNKPVIRNKLADTAHIYD